MRRLKSSHVTGHLRGARRVRSLEPTVGIVGFDLSNPPTNYPFSCEVSVLNEKVRLRQVPVNSALTGGQVRRCWLNHA